MKLDIRSVLLGCLIGTSVWSLTLIGILQIASPISGSEAAMKKEIAKLRDEAGEK